MHQSNRNKKRIILVGSIGVVLLIAGLIIGYLVFQASQAEEDPFVEPLATQSDDQTPESPEPVTPVETPEDLQEDAATPAVTLDPSTVSTVDVEPLDITVSYVQGVPGFSFVVLRTQDGTEYVEFRNEDLAGSRCTNDEGAFASIIVGPSEQDIPTLAQTVTVDETVYGLSLPDDTCTNNESLFEQYQESFSDAFSLLSVLDS